MREEVLIQEFLDGINERAEERFNGHLHQAFLDWYVEAEFGKLKWHFTDDANDGGIDAVVWNPDYSPPVFLIQSKFTEHVGKSTLPHGAHRGLSGAVEAFYRRDETFEEWLSRVRDDLRALYRKAFDRLTDRRNWKAEKRAFRLVTTHTRLRSGESSRIPIENYAYAQDILRLYGQFRKGATPRARPLALHVEDKLSYRDKKRRVTSYLFNARLSDFRDYLADNDVARLVARNIRYNLGGRVGREIRSTFEKQPNNFWYVHNGLTMVCDEFAERDGTATLVNPSVINGAQTLYAISGSPKKTSSALVTTRVIVRGNRNDGAMEDDHWLQRVIRGVNTQNRVRAYDFRSNEPEQIELQNRFRELRVFYERKRGEWKEFRNEPRFRGFQRLSLRTLGQILAATGDHDGHGVLLVKRGVEEIFQPKPYGKLFPMKGRVARRFRRMYLAYRIYRLLDEYGYRNAREYRRQRHGFWNALWLLHLGVGGGLQNGVSVQAIKEAFDRFEKSGRAGQRARKAVRRLRKAVWTAWRQSRRADPELWTPANFFKASFGNRKVRRLALPKVRRELLALGKSIANGG
ncbi:AIPR family protein [bacterium]|nr:AIPR family protein [bacterium]